MIPARFLRRLLLASLLGAACLPALASPEGLEALDAAAKQEITTAAATAVDGVLAGPRFYGRGTGQKGNEEAARWLASELRAAGLQPAPLEGVTPTGGPEDFLQWFDVPAARLNRAAKSRTANVVGFLPGGPPPTKEGAPEFVVLGSHMDHLGFPGDVLKDGSPAKKNNVFWGADDNGSGSTANLLVARTLGRLARGGTKPRRAVVVIFFAAEELGLLGSKNYVEHPPFPLADTVAMINIDMVGRNATKYLEIYGNTSSPELDVWNQEVLAETKFECEYPNPELLYRSDQMNFLEKGIPALFFFGGFHKDYHKQTDTVDKINFPKIALVARQALGVLWRAADAEKRPAYLKVDMKGMGGRLGLVVGTCTPEDQEPLGLSEKAAAVRVNTVFAGGLGEKSFEVGDLIYAWNGFPLFADDPVGRFTAFLNAARPGDSIVIRYARGKERKAATVKF